MIVNKFIEVLGEECYLTYHSFKDHPGESRAMLEIYKGNNLRIGLYLVSHNCYIVGVLGQRFRYRTLLDAKIKIMKYFTNT